MLHSPSSFEVYKPLLAGISRVCTGEFQHSWWTESTLELLDIMLLSQRTGGADAHVPTPGGRDHQDRRGIEALLAEIPREGRRPGRALPFLDLSDAEGETAAPPGRLCPGLLTRAA